MPDLSLEIQHGRQSGKIICGVDEVGRGPLAGPVVAAALIIPGNLPSDLVVTINDSKKMSAQERERLYVPLTSLCPHGIAIGDIEDIERLNILWASMLAMQRAVAALPVCPDIALIDGNRCPKLNCETYAIIKGDALSLSIAAASIIAKVFRDRLMTEHANTYPHYGWERNAGYGTPQHLSALQEYGPTPLHRRSFAPVAACIAKEN